MPSGLPFSSADILIPNTDLSKWATIACDQFTSQSEYWEKVKKEVGEFPSCFRITLPEIFLHDNSDKRIADINKTMKSYLESGLFTEYKDALILTEREVTGGKIRRGLLGKFSLSEYDYEKGSKPLIRPTEGTVVSRIPARVDIRKGASLELPHIMILMDDGGEMILESVNTASQTLLYDFELMLGGGKIRGWLLSEETKKEVLSKLKVLADECVSQGKMLFAVGDGNHSLAAAKAAAEIIGTKEAQYALAELVNIHSEGIEFEPIYRVVFNIEADDFIDKLHKAFPDGSERKVGYLSAGRSGELWIDGLEADVLQKFIDEYISEHPGAEVDYIHGEEAVRGMAEKENTVGLLFGGMDKSELFDYVNENGVLPRKTFSIGQATDKRYYLEARIIAPNGSERYEQRKTEKICRAYCKKRRKRPEGAAGRDPYRGRADRVC